MLTQTLYYENCHLARFQSRVFSCAQAPKGWDITLESTAFYPEGGGQAADTGTLGNVRVLHTREEGGTVVHLCDGPLTPGTDVEGTLDWEGRFRRMQQHTGEHIVSGIIHRRYGFHNTGFHMGSELITIDFDGVIPPQDLPSLEAEANSAVWANLQVRCFIPDPAELERTSYRTKRALPWPVRIVQVPGFDSCACCGVHVAATGEIGLIKLFSAIPFRGGTRMEIACGGAALAVLNRGWEQNKLVSQAFSVPVDQTGAGAQRMNDTLTGLKYRITGLRRELNRRTAADQAGKGDVLHFEEGLDGTELRELADAIAETCGGTAAVFSGTEAEGYGFCLASRNADLRPVCKAMTSALGGRGGGKPGFQQGRVSAGQSAIETFFATWEE